MFIGRTGNRAAARRAEREPEVVFAYFVDPEKMRRWFGSRVQLERRPNGLYVANINPQACARGVFLYGADGGARHLIVFEQTHGHHKASAITMPARVVLTWS